jgi:hypothetical protein
MKRITAIICLTGLAVLAGALTVEVRMDPTLWDGRQAAPSVSPLLEPGVPMLNYVPLRVLLPFGERLESVVVAMDDPVLQRSGFEPDFARAQQPVTLPAPDLTVKDPLIWNADALYPARDYDLLGTQFYRGCQIAVINLYPYRYNPVSRSLYASSGATIRLNTVWDEALAARQANFYPSQSDNSELRSAVLNPEALASYAAAPRYRTHTPQSRTIDLSVPKMMIVITDATRAPWFGDYVQWRADLGISTGIFLTSDIYNDYPGEDNAAKVRNFIIDAYQTWADTATPLEYVILGGDDEIVPERGCYGQVGDTVDNRMPTDIYFSNLDGDWNADGDNHYGEQLDDVDMLPEVHIGRFPAETFQEFDNIFRKTQYYVNQSTFSNNISIMFGENLNNNPMTWGGDYKDDVATHIPEDYALRTMYQRDGTYSETGVWNAINNGANVMNHMGHANETFLLGQGNNTIEQLQNTEYGFLYTQGCYPAAFDQRTSGDGESIGEHMSTAAGGLFAFIGNTRYGWYAPGSINGASQFYDRQYFIGLFETLNTQLGKALTYSRVQNLNEALSNGVMRWCYYEVVLFGDPSIEVKYPDPSLPYLNLQSYTISDVEGDNDGNINPGEVLRIYPVIENETGWATAYDVSVRIEGTPAGVEVLSPCIYIPQLPAGQTSDPSLFIRIQIPPDAEYGNYSLKLVMESVHPVTQLSTGIRTNTITYGLTMLDNRFPWDCQVGSKTSPIVYDFDNDGDNDIMYLDVAGQAYVINELGEQYATYTGPDDYEIMRSSALGDVNADGVMDVVFASRSGGIRALSVAGTPVWDYQGGSPFLFTPVIADINGDDINEVIANSLDGKIHVINQSGNAFPGFPVNLNSPYFTEIAAADLDNDGALEIIAGTQNGSLHALKSDGNELPGFPVQAQGIISGAPTVLDNGRILLGTNSQALLVDTDGSILFSVPIEAAMASGPALADMDRDGDLDLVFVTLNGYLHVMDQQGNDHPGFPVNVGVNFTCPPLIASLDDDVYLEILLSSYINSTYAYNHDGSPLPGFPFVTSFNGATPATLCDFDDDGTLKLVAGYSTGVLMLNLRRPETDKMPWVVYRGSLSRQGSFASTGYVDNDDEAVPAPQTALSQNYPNPFNPSTTIRFQLKDDGPARLSIHNLKGQLVRVLQDGSLSKGNHQAVWDGRDSRGGSVASGIYFYRLESGGKTVTRRMLLLK